MNTRGIIGRRITAIHQERVPGTPARAGYWRVLRIVLDNGTTLHPVTIETEHGTDYDHTFGITKRRKGAPKP